MQKEGNDVYKDKKFSLQSNIIDLVYYAHPPNSGAVVFSAAACPYASSLVMLSTTFTGTFHGTSYFSTAQQNRD